MGREVVKLVADVNRITPMAVKLGGHTQISFRSVAVITCASHAQGPRFDPGRKHFLIFYQIFYSSLIPFQNPCT